MQYGKKDAQGTKCLECGDEIGYGRPDRKFCSLACKNRFNNRKNQGGRQIKLKVMNALNKNHEILSGLLKLGITDMDMMEMKQLGFNPDYITSIMRTRGKDEFCCFDIRYHVTPTRITSIYRMPKKTLSEG